MSDVKAGVKRIHCLNVFTAINHHVDLMTCMKDSQLMHVAAGQMCTGKKKQKMRCESLKRHLKGSSAALRGELGNCVLEAVHPISSQICLGSKVVCVSFDVMSHADPAVSLLLSRRSCLVELVPSGCV